MSLAHAFERFVELADRLDPFAEDALPHGQLHEEVVKALAELSPWLGFDPVGSVFDVEELDDAPQNSLVLLVTNEAPTATLFAIPEAFVEPPYDEALDIAHGCKWRTPDTADEDIGEILEWAAVLRVIFAITDPEEVPAELHDYFVGRSSGLFDAGTEHLPDLDETEDILGMWAEFRVDRAEHLRGRIKRIVCLNAFFN